MKDLRRFIKTTIREFYEQMNNSIKYISGSDFMEKYCDRDNKLLWKGYFDYENEF